MRLILKIIVDFKKANVAEAAEEFYMRLIKEDLLSSDKIDLGLIMDKLNDFRKEVERSIRNSETDYLPNENAKELAAYKDPGASQGVRGVMAWNIVNPDVPIEFPAKVSIIKMTIETPDDMSELKKTNPEIYDRIMEGVFNDTKKIFIKPRKNSKGVYVPTCSGLTVLALPAGVKIPEWALDYIDYRTITNNVLSPFKAVTEIFNLPGIEEGKTGKKTTGISNIIKL